MKILRLNPRFLLFFLSVKLGLLPPKLKLLPPKLMVLQPKPKCHLSNHKILQPKLKLFLPNKDFFGQINTFSTQTWAASVETKTRCLMHNLKLLLLLIHHGWGLLTSNQGNFWFLGKPKLLSPIWGFLCPKISYCQNRKSHSLAKTKLFSLKLRPHPHGHWQSHFLTKHGRLSPKNKIYFPQTEDFSS